VVLPGQEPMPVDTQVFSSPITVTARKVPLKEKAGNFLSDSWEFIVGTIILGSGLSKWLMDRIRARSRRKEMGASEGGKEGEEGEEEAREAEVAEIDLAALEEEAASIGQRDQKAAREDRKDTGKEKEIDFAALEEAVIGRTEAESGEVKEDQLEEDRFEEDRPERGRGPEEVKRPEGPEEREEAKGPGRMGE